MSLPNLLHIGIDVLKASLNIAIGSALPPSSTSNDLDRFDTIQVELAIRFILSSWRPLAG